MRRSSRRVDRAIAVVMMERVLLALPVRVGLSVVDADRVVAAHKLCLCVAICHVFPH